MYYNYDSEFKQKVLNMSIEEIKNSKDSKEIILCAKLRTDASVDELAEVIKNFSSKDIVEFAVEVSNAPVDKLAVAIIEKGEAKWICEYILNIDNISIEDCAKNIANSNKIKSICEYAKNDERFNELIKQVGIQISKGDNVKAKEYYAKNIAKMPVDEFVNTYSDIIFVALEEDENFAE